MSLLHVSVADSLKIFNTVSKVVHEKEPKVYTCFSKLNLLRPLFVFLPLVLFVFVF